MSELGYVVATLAISVLATAGAVWFVLTRPQHLDSEAKGTTFMIWLGISVPVGMVIFVVTVVVYLSSVGHGGWDANPAALRFSVATPLSLILNIMLLLIAGARNERRGRRHSEAQIYQEI